MALFYCAAVACALTLAIVGARILTVDKCGDCSPFAIETARSLREEAQRWTEDRHNVMRDDGLQLWTASGATYLRPWLMEGNPDQWKVGRLIASREQSFVWQAYKEWHEKTQQPPPAWSGR